MLIDGGGGRGAARESLSARRPCSFGLFQLGPIFERGPLWRGRRLPAPPREGRPTYNRANQDCRRCWNHPRQPWPPAGRGRVLRTTRHVLQPYERRQLERAPGAVRRVRLDAGAFRWRERRVEVGREHVGIGTRRPGGVVSRCSVRASRLSKLSDIMRPSVSSGRARGPRSGPPRMNDRPVSDLASRQGADNPQPSSALESRRVRWSSGASAAWAKHSVMAASLRPCSARRWCSTRRRRSARARSSLRDTVASCSPVMRPTWASVRSSP